MGCGTGRSPTNVPFRKYSNTSFSLLISLRKRWERVRGERERAEVERGEREREREREKVNFKDITHTCHHKVSRLEVLIFVVISALYEEEVYLSKF